MLSIKTGCKSDPETLQALQERQQETSDEEEEKTSLQDQLRKSPTQATQAQATPPQINITNIRIKPGNTTVYLFPERKPFVNRRFTPYEREQEKIDALFLKRPQREFFYDPPTYPYCVPEPKVNFDLGWR